jgi:serine/threonine protein kinase/WD40 repeat protein
MCANCPDPEKLLAFALGRLDDEQSQAIASHTDVCPACEKTLSGMDQASDTLVSHLREPDVEPQFAKKPEYAEALRRVKTQAAEAIQAAAAEPAASGDKEPSKRADVDISFTQQSQPREGDTSVAGLGRLGEYELLDKLGEGGMGAVYKARQIRLAKIVALKVLPQGRTTDPRARARFEREMQAIGRVSHPNIVQAHDARDIDGTTVLVMEYADGIDLSQLIRRQERLAIPDACELIRQAAVGLQCAHDNGLVHRDIKPSNLMLTRQGVVKILDLGLALLGTEQPGEGELTSSGQAMGTADYIAPEQATDSHRVDIRADIYSLGCTLFKLLTGRPPFFGPQYRTVTAKMLAHVTAPVTPIRDLRPDVPKDLAAALDRMLAKKPEERFATPAEVAAAMEQFAKQADLTRLHAKTVEPGHSAETAQPDDATRSADRDNDGGSEDKSPLGDSGQVQSFARRYRPWIAAGIALAIAGGGIWAAMMLVRIRDKEGNIVAELKVPEGGKAEVFDDGDAKREQGKPNVSAGLLPGQRQGTATDAPPRSLVAPWQPCPAEDAQPGIIPRPAKLPGIHRWQMETADGWCGERLVTAWSPDARHIALGNAVAHEIRIIDAKTLELVRVLLGHTTGTQQIVWSPQWLASSGVENSRVRIWKPDGTPLRTIEWPGVHPIVLVPSPDGKRLGLLGAGSARLFEIGGTLPPVDLEGAGSIYWSQDGNRLAAHQTNGAVCVWRTDGTRERELKVHLQQPGQGTAIAWSPDGERLACVTADGKLQILGTDGTAGPSMDAHGATDVAWSSHADWLATTGGEGQVRLWKPDGTAGPVFDVRRGDAGRWLAVSPDGKYLAYTYYTGGPEPVEIWRLEAEPTKAASVPVLQVLGIHWSADSRHLTFDNGNYGMNCLTVVNIGDTKINAVRAPQIDSARCGGSAWWRHDGSGLLSLSGPPAKAVGLWDAEGMLVKSDSNVEQFAWQADRRHLALRKEREIRIWDTNPTNPEPDQTIEGLEVWDTYDRRWSPDGALTATHAGNNVQLWKPDGTPLRTLSGHTAAVCAFTWASDSQASASLARDGQVRVWKADGTLRSSFQVDKTAQRLTFRPNAEQLAIISPEAVSIRTLDGQAVRTLKASYRTGFAWAPKGDRYAWYTHQRIHIEDCQGRRLPFGMVGDYRANALSWSPNGHELAISFEDGLVRVWDVEANGPRWGALQFGDGTHVSFTPAGQIIVGEESVCGKQLVYVVQRTPDGPQELWTYKQFEEHVKQAGMGLRTTR